MLVVTGDRERDGNSMPQSDLLAFLFGFYSSNFALGMTIA